MLAPENDVYQGNDGSLEYHESKNGFTIQRVKFEQAR